MLSVTYKNFLSEYISDIYLDEEYLLEQKHKFDTEKNVKHCIFPNFLKKEYADALKNEIIDATFDYDDLYTDEKNYKKWTGAYVSWKKLHWIFRLFHSKAFFEYMKIFYNSSVHTPVKFWVKCENLMRAITGSSWAMLQIYNPWDYLTWHTDGPVEEVAWSYVFFMTPEWNDEQWWQLEFWQKNLSSQEIVSYKTVTPTYNNFVFFKCEKDFSWHRVHEVYSWKRLTYHDQLFYKK